MSAALNRISDVLLTFPGTAVLFYDLPFAPLLTKEVISLSFISEVFFLLCLQ